MIKEVCIDGERPGVDHIRLMLEQGDDFAMPACQSKFQACFRGSLVILALIAGCQPAEVGTISAPPLNRSQGPTTNPNQPNGA